MEFSTKEPASNFNILHVFWGGGVGEITPAGAPHATMSADTLFAPLRAQFYEKIKYLFRMQVVTLPKILTHVVWVKFVSCRRKI